MSWMGFRANSSAAKSKMQRTSKTRTSTSRRSRSSRIPASSSFLHEFVGTQATSNEELQEAAREQGEGFVYMIDQRTPDTDGDVPQMDIIGAFEIKDGQITADSYAPNPSHKMITEAGLVDIGDDLRDLMLEH